MRLGRRGVALLIILGIMVALCGCPAGDESDVVGQGKPAGEVEADTELLPEEESTEPELSAGSESAEGNSTEGESAEGESAEGENAETSETDGDETAAQETTDITAQTTAQTSAQATAGAVTQATTQTPTQATTAAFNCYDQSAVYAKATSLSAGQQALYSELVAGINAYRAQAGLAAVTMTQALDTAATMRAVEIDYSGCELSHYRLDGSKFSSAILYCGVSYTACGETLARNYGSYAEALQAWMDSETHRNIILNGTYTHVGVGYCNDRGHLVWVLEFTD